MNQRPPPVNRRAFLHHLAATSAAAGSLLIPAQNAPDSEASPPSSRPRPSANPASGAPVSEEFEVAVGTRRVVPRLVAPPKERLATKPLLLVSLSMDRETALTKPPYSLAVDAFLAQGHRAVSFDLPNHGARVDGYGDGIEGLRNAWVKGEDRFRQGVEEAAAVVSRCLDRGWAEPGRIVVYGISRGGYLAVRWLAEDPRVAAGAAIAPVTDWRDLAEFAAERTRDDLAELRLERYVDGLVRKRLFVVIGHQDGRVSTVSCCRFFTRLQEAKVRLDAEGPAAEFHCAEMAEPGHSVDERWRRMGAEFLIRTPA